MDSMHPDPEPVVPLSLDELRAQITKLEAAHKARGIPLSGRIIHVCHHLPVEIVRVVDPSALETGEYLSPPMTPEFKPEDADPKHESHDSRWRIHARTAHTAMISGMRSLSDSHENIVVAWTGEVLLQTQSQPTPTSQPLPTFSSIAEEWVGGGGQGATATPTAPSPAPQIPPQEEKLKVFGGEFNEDEKKELQGELDRFREVEAAADTDGSLRYVPVFIPPDVSKGHYEGFCKKTLWPLFHYLLWLDSTATVPSPDPLWLAYEKANALFADKVAEIYRPGDLILVHDYHLLLAPKMIRDRLQVSNHPAGGNVPGTVVPSPAARSENRKMDWEYNDATPTTREQNEKDRSRMDRLGGFLGKAASALGHTVGANGQHNEQAEIMIGMFMHTPWPSSEIFRCLPSKSPHPSEESTC